VRAKADVHELAIFGGSPCFSEPVHVGRPSLSDPASFLRRFERILSTNRFTNDGPFVQEFEQSIAELSGAKFCVATCNATCALQLLARASNLKGEIVMPAFTFIATAHAFAWLGLEPVFCDIEAGTHTIDTASVQRAIGPHCCAIVGVHTWGIPCDVAGLERVAQDRGLVLILDAAHALGCTYAGRAVGSLGHSTVFSFHATKFVHSCEGGAITTDSAELATNLRTMRDFGFAGPDDVRCLGTNPR
jgi:dTDP-4-amino-4,6-dideoxyglucose